MKMQDISLRITVDIARLETLMEELRAFHYVPHNGCAKEAIPHPSGLGERIHIPTLPTFIHLQCKKIPAATLEALLQIGGCTISKGNEGHALIVDLDAAMYHQFCSDGLIFSTHGPAFDPSYSTLHVITTQWILRRYKSAQYGDTQIDKRVARRDNEWVLFPIGTQETIQSSLVKGDERTYTLPDESSEVIMVISSNGYLYQRTHEKKRVFKKGDPVLITIQGHVLKGIYDTEAVGMSYVDFDPDEREYLLIDTSCVFPVDTHAE